MNLTSRTLGQARVAFSETDLSRVELGMWPHGRTRQPKRETARAVLRGYGAPAAVSRISISLRYRTGVPCLSAGWNFQSRAARSSIAS
jgi:hypothetical protein